MIVQNEPTTAGGKAEISFHRFRARICARARTALEAARGRPPFEKLQAGDEIGKVVDRRLPACAHTLVVAAKVFGVLARRGGEHRDDLDGPPIKISCVIDRDRVAHLAVAGAAQRVRALGNPARLGEEQPFKARQTL